MLDQDTRKGRKNEGRKGKLAWRGVFVTLTLSEWNWEGWNGLHAWNWNWAGK